MDEKLDFLLKVLEATRNSKGNSEVVYPLLRANLDKLDDNFITLLQKWAEIRLLGVNSSQAKGIARIIGNFSTIMLRFPLGSKATNIEISIVGCEIAATVFTRDNDLETWAIIQNNLGIAYSNRISGNKADNVEKAIAAFQQALEVQTEEAFPIDRAITLYNLGNAYSERIFGDKAGNLEEALTSFQSALLVCKQETFPVDWALIQGGLGAAYKDRIFGERAENLEKAIAAFQRALQVYTQKAFPIEWAATQNNLGLACYERILGEKTKNLEDAITAFHKALQVYTQETFPIEWATAQNNLGLAYCDRILGNRGDNLEKAILAFQKALQVRSKEALPIEWATTYNNLGYAYCNRILGNRGDNLEKAILAFQKALQVRSKEALPLQWAKTQVGLANAYSNRILGNRGENLEKAFSILQKALQVYTKEGLPLEWAGTHLSLGNAYCNRILGDKADNVEKAIASQELALQVYTKEGLPLEWAETHFSLGNAYCNRILGDKADNVEKAIASQELALQVYTKDELPFEWARTHLNLGNAYCNRILGDKADNVEKAIASYELALQVYTKEGLPFERAGTHSNLGNAYCYRILGDKADNVEKAIAYYELALQVYTKEELPFEWAGTQNNLGNAYGERRACNRAKNLEMPIAAYQKALQVYTPTTDPLNCLNTARSLGDLHFKQSNWLDAIDAYKKAIKSVERSRSWATTDDRRQQILTEAIGVYDNIIQCFVNLQQYDQAVEYADRSRSRLLVELMAGKDLYPDAETPPEVEEYLQLQRQLDRLRHPPESGGMGELSRSPYHRDDTGKLQEQKTDKIQELEGRKKQLWQQIRKTDPVLAGQLQVDPLKIEDIQQLIENERTAILNFYTTKEDTYIFVLRQNSTTLHTCQGQGIETLQLWMRQNWLIPYLSNREQWCDKIGPFLSELAQRLQLQQLIDEHLADIEELVIVPHLFLHQMPFAALPIANSIPTADSDSATDTTRGMTFSRKRPPAKKPKPAPTPKPTYLSDKYRLRVIPSCQILSYCHENKKKKKIPPSPQMGIVENATNDLPFSGYECQAIATTYGVPESLHLKGDRATPTNYHHLAKQVQLLHSSHHAKADLNDPLNSKLDLAGGEVTLGEIFTWRLSDLVEVFLACCETNFNPQTTPADDILVIAAGWLSAGALNVVSTLWAVDDCATALFSIFYYRQRQQQPTLERSEALREAQRQLRNLTGKEFKAQYRAPLEAHLRKIGKNGDLKEHCDLQHPFESPRYWAAFVSQGMN